MAKFSDYPPATNPADYDDDSTFLLQNPTGYTKLGNLGDFKDTVLSDHNTLDEAYDEGGAGLGRTITADSGAVKIDGVDGFLISGIFGSGAAAELSGAGTRMFFNPNTSAFRAGYVDGTQWDVGNIGNHSFAAGNSTTASGTASVSFGLSCISSGHYSTTLGQSNHATGDYSFANGYLSLATGDYSTAIGSGVIASGDLSSAFGLDMEAPSYSEFIVGMFQETYTPTSATAWSATDRIFTVGNGSAGGSRSNALTILKNGNTTIGGALNLPYVAKTANYTATASDHTIDATANSFTVTLPTAVGITGRVYNIHNSGTGTITVDADGTETIEGDLTQEVNQWENLKIQSTGANWIVL